MTLNEAQIIGALTEIFGTNHRGVQVGIGDDAAVVATGEHTVITTDMAVEGTHFDCQWSGAFQIGRKITAANLADIYAMGATPTYLVVALTLSGEESMEWISELAQGIKHEASSCGAVVVGGDLARGAIKVISMSALGEVEKVVTRSGAQVGDLIYLSSLPGWSGAGLSFIEKSELSDLENYAVEEFCSPTLDYSLAVAFANKGAHAMCDISDALVTQAAQLAYASDVQLVFDPEAFKASEEFSQLSELAEVSGRDVWQWIFAGGEDHVFLATGKDLPGLCVGVVKEGSGVLGLEMKKAPETWRHFS
ncbi:MAG: thiamine-phosphate kinase [Actinobacteria bacterium]|nr:thiamine-phosphate kinase [Actinomycetota bacterium]NDE40343.1 thiamine-phosphate kinase [Actinomycetota bacterium]